MRRHPAPRGPSRAPGRPPRGTPRAERFRAGRALRQRLRRSEQGRWEPSRDRPDPVDLLTRADASRVPELLPIRYGRMAASPFGFLRGAAAVMAHDLSQLPTTGLTVQLVGDAHVANFGLFATPEREQVFDANDFDETFPGPWEWDLKRLATSLYLTARGNRFSRKVARGAARAAARSYQDRIATFARMRYLDAWYAHLDLAEADREVGRRGTRLLREELPRARQRTGFHAFPRLARGGGGAARIVAAPPLIRHYRRPADEAMVREAFRQYRSTLPAERCTLFDRYRLVDVAQKVVGIGSVGTRCAVGLFLADPDVAEPLFLQVKEADPSVYERYLGAGPYANHAERVVVGQRLVQEASDILLGWSRAHGHDFYVRQLRDMKFSSELTALGPNRLVGQAQLCAAALARAHARTGDAAAIAGYVGDGPPFVRAIAAFAEGYAAQTERDHAALTRAIATGRLAAVDPAAVRGRR